MIFHAVGAMEYRCHPYAIHWTTRGYDAWNMSKRKACLGRELTIAEAMDACEQDALRESLGAVSIK